MVFAHGEETAVVCAGWGIGGLLGMTALSFVLFAARRARRKARWLGWVTVLYVVFVCGLFVVSNMKSALRHGVKFKFDAADATLLLFSFGPPLTFAIIAIVMSYKKVVDDAGLLCNQCGYSLRGNVSGRCPECGTVIASSSNAQGSE
jgi:hypothetical protein